MYDALGCCVTNGGFARRGMLIYAHEFTPLVGFILIQCGIEKKTQNMLLLGLVFLSLLCSLVLYYELDKKFRYIYTFVVFSNT